MSQEEIYNYFNISINKRDDINSIFNTTTARQYKQQVSELNKKMTEYIEYMKNSQIDIIQNVFKNLDNKQVHLPIAFTHIINNVQGQENLNTDSIIDITPLEAFELIENTYKLLNNLTYSKPNKLFYCIILLLLIA